jgi:hypothetical protein
MTRRTRSANTGHGRASIKVSLVQSRQPGPDAPAARRPQMIETIRHCRDCGCDRLFELHHPEPGGCPDYLDGECAEWSCTSCGAGLLVGFSLFAYEPAEISDLLNRVA